MQGRNNYQTKQKQEIRATIRRRRKSFTIGDLKKSFDRRGVAVGETTIYRTVSELVRRGEIVKTIGRDNETIYEYLKPCANNDHFYLKCDNCGKLEYVDCKKIRGLNNHIMEKHHFKVLNDFIIINGVCENCY